MALVTSSSASPRVAPALLALLVLGVALAAVGLTALALDRGSWLAWLAVAGLALVAAAMALAALAPRRRSLDDITAAARAFADGRYDTRVDVTDDSLADLAAALNAAAEHVNRTVATLQSERAQLEALLQASSDATVAIDRDGAVVFWNDAARNLFAPAAVLDEHRPFIEVVRDHDLNDLVVAAARRRERSVRVVPYGPAQRWLQATAVPIEGGEEWAALAVFHDLTEVRRLDSMRRDFISNVSHELRTPLAGIRAAAETLQEGALDDRDAAQEFLGHIQRETDRMTQLVEELLELSRIESGAAPMRFVQTDAAVLVSEVIRRFRQQAERARLSLTAVTPDSPLTIIADAERLDRAVGNLVANAIKFTPEGGVITVEAAQSGDDVTITVRDTGVGIDQQAQERVFERFYRTDAARGGRGTGLGLAIVKHTVRAHEGSVSVESRLGQGSAFTIRLPRR